MSKRFVVGDLHFGHDNIIKLANRPFKNVEEMDRTLIENWNNVVGKNDYVYIVGDFVFTRKDRSVGDYAKQLNGYKILIKGNHDRIKNEDKKYFWKIVNYEELRIGNQLYIFNHYPMTAWNGAFNNSIMLYGHVHSTGHDFEIPKLPNIHNVCCELHDFKPVNIKEFKAVNFVNYMLSKKLLTQR